MIFLIICVLIDDFNERKLIFTLSEFPFFLLHGEPGHRLILSERRGLVNPHETNFSNSVVPVLSSIRGTALLLSFKIKNKIKMVRAWYMGDSDADQRLEHHKEPPEFVTLSELFDVSGTEYFKVNHENYDKDETLLKLKKERGYSYEDEIICSEKCLPNYEEKLKNFFTEHLHTDEEIRLILDGSGYFDVRDKNDKWIRIEVTPGDLLIIPSGIYHRFTLDVKNYIKAKRYFVGEPVWLPYNRPADEMECRKTYLEKIKRGFTVEVK